MQCFPSLHLSIQSLYGWMSIYVVFFGFYFLISILNGSASSPRRCGDVLLFIIVMVCLDL